MELPESAWEQCVSSLQSELPAQQFNTWIRPLRVQQTEVSSQLHLLAPNRFVLDWVNDKFRSRIDELLSSVDHHPITNVEISVAPRRSTSFETNSGAAARQANRTVQSREQEIQRTANNVHAPAHQSHQASTNYEPQPAVQAPVESPMAQVELLPAAPPAPMNNGYTESFAQPYNDNPMGQNKVGKVDVEGGLQHKSNLNPTFIFDNFVVGKSNQLGLAAASQVAENPGGSYNPLFIYGGVGLGKTHLMHAVGNALCARKPGAKVVYLHSERFVADMVKALQLNAINDFKRYYRSVDALLIDDIQFFAGKERSQEEFFHTFNALLEGGQQIILTCDRYPKEINGLEERLKSRFGWGLTVAIEPPELETRVAILKRKAEQVGADLPNDAAFFIAQRIRSNVRELEGALKRVIANAHFTGRDISVELVREALKDLLALQDRLVSIDNIQRVVAEYYKIKVSDLHSKRRSRSVARPRQVAMYLAKDLTHHSLPEIGEAFGGRDHTTVLHACRKIKEMIESDADIREDVKNLLRTLTT